jgi:hypothetical protein
MTRSAMPDRRPAVLAPLGEQTDHLRGPAAGRLIIEYGDHECSISARRSG